MNRNNFQKCFNVVYRLKNGRIEIALHIIGFTVHEAKMFIEKKMEDSPRFEKVLIAIRS
jgi:hypothetical protein